MPLLTLQRWCLQSSPHLSSSFTSHCSPRVVLCSHISEQPLPSHSSRRSLIHPLHSCGTPLRLQTVDDDNVETSHQRMLTCCRGSTKMSIGLSVIDDVPIVIFLCDGYLFCELVRALCFLPMQASLFAFLTARICRTGSVGKRRRIGLLFTFPDTYVLDSKSSTRFSSILNKRIILDEAMAWLSTLGGGFSCLGDQYSDAAEIAGDISLRQFQLAEELGNPLIQTKCRLWFAQSLMQRGELRAAARLIKRIYRWHWGVFSEEEKIHLMCQGLWHRLMFFWKHRHQIRRKRLYDDVDRIVGTI